MKQIDLNVLLGTFYKKDLERLQINLIGNVRTFNIGQLDSSASEKKIYNKNIFIKSLQTKTDLENFIKTYDNHYLLVLPFNRKTFYLHRLLTKFNRRYSYVALGLQPKSLKNILFS